MKETILQLLEDEKEQWLSDNAKMKTEKVSYGDSEVTMCVGYSDSDWKRATEFAEESLRAAVKDALNHNRITNASEDIFKTLGQAFNPNQNRI